MSPYLNYYILLLRQTNCSIQIFLRASILKKPISFFFLLLKISWFFSRLLKSNKASRFFKFFIISFVFTLNTNTHPYQCNVIVVFFVQNLVVIYHNMSHTCVTCLLLIQQILSKSAYPLHFVEGFILFKFIAIIFHMIYEFHWKLV